MLIIRNKNTNNDLDLAPGQEITFTLENPLFAEDHLPIAVSTGIELALTPDNKKQCGFVNAMMLPPTIQIIPVAIILSGIEIFIGELQFDEYSDKALKYTFTGGRSESLLAGKIHEIPSETYDNIELSTFVQNARANNYDDVRLPQIIRAANSAKIEYVTPTQIAECSIIDKYANYLYSTTPYVVPAINVRYLLGKILPKVFAPSEMDRMLHQIAIIAPYKPKEWQNEYYGVPMYSPAPGNRPSINTKIKNFKPTEGLPDMSNSEFLSNLLKMFCATLFTYKDKYVIISNDDIITDKTHTDWTDKVADIYSIVAGEENAYSLEYLNENSSYTPSKVDDLGQSQIAPSITTCYSYQEMIQKFRQSIGYINVQISQTQNIYSGKQVRARLYYHYIGNGRAIEYHNLTSEIPTMDIVYQAGLEKKTINNKNDSIKTHENNIGFYCVKCIPANVATPIYEGSTNAQVTLCSISPLVDIPAIGEDRPSAAHIGLLIGNNFLDQGNYFSPPTPYIDGGVEMSDNIYSIAIGGELGLYNKFHKAFAEWFVKKKDSIKTEVLLSPTDVANLRLWHKIMIYNRLFFIKTMEITISDKTDIVFATVEFVEA